MEAYNTSSSEESFYVDDLLEMVFKPYKRIKMIKDFECVEIIETIWQEFHTCLLEKAQGIQEEACQEVRYKLHTLIKCDPWDVNHHIQVFIEKGLLTLDQSGNKAPSQIEAVFYALTQDVKKMQEIVRSISATQIPFFIHYFLRLGTLEKIDELRKQLLELSRSKEALLPALTQVQNFEKKRNEMVDYVKYPQILSRKQLTLESVSTDKQIESISQRMRKWDKIIQDFFEIANAKSTLIPEQKKCQVMDCRTLVRWVSEWVEDTDNNDIKDFFDVYIAMDSNKKIQGIACTCFCDASKSVKVLYLLSNPKNLNIRASNHSMRGVGTALMQYVAQKALNLKYRCIELDATDSAKDWYINTLGFEEKSNLYGLSLGQEGMEKLVKL